MKKIKSQIKTKELIPKSTCDYTGKFTSVLKIVGWGKNSVAELQLSVLRLRVPSQRFQHKIIKHRISITTLAHTLKIGSFNSRYSSYINALLVETRGGYVKSFNRRKSASDTTAHQYSHRGNCATCSSPPILASPVVAPKGQSHWAEGAHLSKGSTPLYAASQQILIGGRGRVLD